MPLLAGGAVATRQASLPKYANKKLAGKKKRFRKSANLKKLLPGNMIDEDKDKIVTQKNVPREIHEMTSDEPCGDGDV